MIKCEEIKIVLLLLLYIDNKVTNYKNVYTIINEIF